MAQPGSVDTNGNDGGDKGLSDARDAAEGADDYSTQAAEAAGTVDEQVCALIGSDDNTMIDMDDINEAERSAAGPLEQRSAAINQG